MRDRELDAPSPDETPEEALARSSLAQRLGSLGREPGLVVKTNPKTWGDVFRRDGQAGPFRKSMPPTRPESPFMGTLNTVMRGLRFMLEGRAAGTEKKIEKGAARTDLIQRYARSMGWPKRGAAKLTIIYFESEAPKSDRCDRRTVTRALAKLRNSK